MKKLLLLSAILFSIIIGASKVSTAQYNNLDTMTPASTTGTSTPGWNIDVIPADTCGPSPSCDAPFSVLQTIGNATPAGGCTSLSMLVSETTNTTSTQTNSLFWYYAAGLDSATNFVFHACIYISNIAYSNNIEMDFDQYNLTQVRLYSFGHQYNIASGCWQIDNNTFGWQPTTACPVMVGNTWYEVTWYGHRVNGDTSCSGLPCNYYDKVIVNGITYNVNMTLPSETLPGGYPSAFVAQFQIDSGPTTAQQTVSYNLEEVDLTAYGTMPGSPMQLTVSPL